MHIGNNKYVKDALVVGIFDIERSTVNEATRRTLADLQSARKIVADACGGLLPKSLVLTDKQAYLSPISSATLAKREF